MLGGDRRDLGGLILRLVGLGKLRRPDDTGAQQRVQVNIGAGGPGELEEVIEAVPRLGEYGLAYCPPDGSEAVIVFLGGRRSSPVVVATGHRASRPKDLQPGEAMLYNGLTGAFVRMCADGKIRSSGDWEHTGDLAVMGAVTATGDITDHALDGHGQSMRASRQTYDGHTHPAGSPNTGVPNQQEPT